MTDQLEHELRTMLTRRGDQISVDVAAGEVAVADRLRADDEGLAEMVAGHSPKHRPWWAAAAAVVVLVVAVGGIAWNASRDDERQLVTQRPVDTASIYTGTGTAADVALAYLVNRLEVSPDQLVVQEVPRQPETPPGVTRVLWSFSELGFAEHPALSFPIRGFVVLQDLDGAAWRVTEAYSDGASIDEVSRAASAITVRSTGPAGSSVQLSVHRIDGGAITAGGCGGVAIGPSGTEVDTGAVRCDLIGEPIQFADEAVTVRLSVVTLDGERLTLEERLVIPTTASDVATSTTP